MKSTRRPGSSMFMATVESSSDKVGEPATICWNSVRTLRCSASTSELFGGIASGTESTRPAHEWRQLGEFGQPYPLQAFGKHEQALVGHLDHFVDDGQGSDGVEIAGLRGIDASFALRHHDNGLVLAQGVNQLNRAFPAYGQGQHGMGEQHRIPHRQDRQYPSLLLLLALECAQCAFFLPYFTLSVLCSSFDDIKTRKDAGLKMT